MDDHLVCPTSFLPTKQIVYFYAVFVNVSPLHDSPKYDIGNRDIMGFYLLFVVLKYYFLFLHREQCKANERYNIFSKI